MLLVHVIDRGLGGLNGLKRNVAFVGECLGFAYAMHLSRLNLTVLGEHRRQLDVVGALGQTLDEKVKEAAILLRALLLTLVIQNLDLLTVEFELAVLRDRQVGCLLTLKLDVAKAPRLTVREELKLTGADGAELLEGVVELLLCNIEIDELHHQVSLGLHEVALLHVTADVVIPDLRVIDLVGAPTRLRVFEELEEAVAILALRLFVHINDCLVDVVPEPLHVLV